MPKSYYTKCLMTIEAQQNTIPNSSFDELAARCKDGDNEAFTELYVLLKDKVYWQLIRLGLNAEDAEDGTQQVFEKAFTAIDRFEPGNLSGWIYAIAHNYAMDHHRKATRRNRHTVRSSLDEIIEPAETDPGFVELDTRWQIDDIIERVKQYDGKTFEDMDLEAILRGVAAGKSRDEISEELGMNKVTIGTRLTRLRKRLVNSAFTSESLHK